jgi:hypothetical protein
LSQLVYTVGFIFAAALALAAYEKIQKVRRRWGFIGFKARYAVAYLRHRGVTV